METNVIINGSCIEELKKLPSNSIDLIFADPPYWMRTAGRLTRVEGTEYDGCDADWDKFETLEQYEEFSREWLSECYRVLKPDGSFWVIGGMQCIFTIGAVMQRLGFWLINDVIWHKKNPTPNFMGSRLNNSHETLIWAAKSKRSKFTFNYKTAKELNVDTVSGKEYASGVRKQMGSVWKFPVCAGNERLKDENGEKLHSTQKPVELLKRVIAVSSKKGDIVLDPFGGTMTTAVAAKALGRQYIMIECDEEYCRCGQKRLDAVTEEDSDISNAVYDIKPRKVTMQEMIAAGFFIPDEWFYFRKGDEVARLTPDGKLDLEGRVMDMHSCAAAAKGSKAARLNGFDHWYVMRDGERVSIAQIREQYRKQL